MNLTRRATRRGFTLIEMLVVLVIIGLLVGLIGPRLFGIADRSKAKTVKVQVKMLDNALLTMELDIGRFPSTQEGLQLLVKQPTAPTLRAKWHGPYLSSKVPMDAWGNPYHYVAPGPDGHPYALWSEGADGKPGGSGLNADIGIVPPGQ